MHAFYRQQKVHINAFMKLVVNYFVTFFFFVRQYMLSKIKISCDKYSLYSKVLCSKVKFTIVYYSKFALGVTHDFEILNIDSSWLEILRL